MPPIEPRSTVQRAVPQLMVLVAALQSSRLWSSLLRFAHWWADMASVMLSCAGLASVFNSVSWTRLTKQRAPAIQCHPLARLWAMYCAPSQPRAADAGRVLGTGPASLQNSIDRSYLLVYKPDSCTMSLNVDRSRRLLPRKAVHQGLQCGVLARSGRRWTITIPLALPPLIVPPLLRPTIKHIVLNVRTALKQHQLNLPQRRLRQ